MREWGVHTVKGAPWLTGGFWAEGSVDHQWKKGGFYGTLSITNTCYDFLTPYKQAFGGAIHRHHVRHQMVENSTCQEAFQWRLGRHIEVRQAVHQMLPHMPGDDLQVANHPEWLGAFADGEGSLDHTFMSAGFYPVFRVSNTDPAILTLFKTRYGGKINLLYPAHDNWQACYTWQLGNHQAVRSALMELQEHFVSKKAQCELVLRGMELPRGIEAVDEHWNLSCEVQRLKGRYTKTPRVPGQYPASVLRWIDQCKKRKGQ